MYAKREKGETKENEKSCKIKEEKIKWRYYTNCISSNNSSSSNTCRSKYTNVKQVNSAKNLKVMSMHERGALSEARAQKKYGGKDQVSYLNGKEVSSNVYGATRPDLVRNVNGKLEAIEVKNYNLDSYLSREGLYKELNRQVTNRVENLPAGSTQRIVLDVQGRNYSKSRIKEVIKGIQEACSSSYSNIPVDVMY